MFLRFVFLILTYSQFGLASQFKVFQGCSSDYRLCAPPGAASNSLGSIGTSWVGLYDSIVSLVSGYSINVAQPPLVVDPDGPAKRELALCCENIATCLLLPERKIPLCWDRFTTNVFFPDGTYGSVISGDFNTSDGGSINLVYGDYKLKDGTKGNIYGQVNNTTEAPNTSTMSIPAVWTASGEGSAIPATGLGTTGSLTTITSTIPGTIVEPTTAPSITVVASRTECVRCPPYNTTIPGPTQPGTSRNATTTTLTSGIITPSMTGSAEVVSLFPRLISLVALILMHVATQANVLLTDEA